MYLYQKKKKFFPLGHLMSHKFKEVTSFLEKKCKMLFFLETNIVTHVGSRLIFFLSVVGNFLLTLSVVSNIFRPLSLVG